MPVDLARWYDYDIAGCYHILLFLVSATLMFSFLRQSSEIGKQRDMLYAACVWEDVVYNFAHHVKTLRLEVNEGRRRWARRSPAMAAGITDQLWTIEELLTRIPLSTNT